jgi:hypothetical protein
VFSIAISNFKNIPKLKSTIGSVAVGTALTTGGLVEEFTQSSLQSLEGIGESINLESGIKESFKGGGFKTTAGSIVERPALSEQELPYLENKIEEVTAKQQVKEQKTNILRNRREKFSLKQNELEGMAAKREASIATEEARLKAIAEEEERLRLEEETLQRQMLAEKNEAARLQKEAEEAKAARVKLAEEERLRKMEEEARIKQEAEEVRIQNEKEMKAERLRILEEESMEKERQEAMAREQRALEILRKQEEELAQQQQRSTATSATAAGANALRDYVSRFSNAFITNEPPSFVDTEKLQLLLSQLGISPRIVGGVAAVLLVGGSMTAIQNLVDEAEENSDVAGKDKGEGEDEDLSSQVAKLLEKKREESTQSPSTVRKTLKISVDSVDDEKTKQQTQTSKSATISPTGGKPNTQPPPSIKFGDGTQQPKVTPPSAKMNSSSRDPKSLVMSSSESPTFDAAQRNKGMPSKTSSNPFQNKIPQSSPSSSSCFGAPTSTKAKFPARSPKNSMSSPSSLSSVNTPPPKNTSKTTASGSPNVSGTPQDNLGLSSGEQAKSTFGAAPKQSSSPFGAAAPKTGPSLPPPKFNKSSGDKKGSPFGTISKQSVPSSQAVSAFGASPPNPAGSSSQKAGSSFGTPGKQSPFVKQSNSPFGTATPKGGSSSAPGFPAPKAAGLPNEFGSSQKKMGGSFSKQTNSPFSTASKQVPPGKQLDSVFGTSPPKTGSSSVFGSPMPKSTGPPNTYGSPPKKFVGSPVKQTNSPFGTAPKQASFGKQPVSPFSTATPKTRSSGAFRSPLKTTVDEPGTKTGSPFGKSPKTDSVMNDIESPSNSNSLKISESDFFYDSLQKQAGVKTEAKKPFSPFSQRGKSNPSFSSSGPVYMPPTSKVNNAASLKNVYSSLDGNRKKNSDGSQENRIEEIKEQDILKTLGPKKSFSPFGRTKPAPKSTFDQSHSTNIAPTSSNTSDMPITVNDPNAFGMSSGSPQQGVKKSFSPYGTKPLDSTSNANFGRTSFVASPTAVTASGEGQGVKKSFSPYGRKPKRSADNVPKVDPSSFSFGPPPSESSSPQKYMNPKSSSATPVSSNRQGYGKISAPKPFAATGFPPTGNGVERDQNDGNSRMKRNGFEDLKNTRSQAMEAIPDEQQKEWD